MHDGGDAREHQLRHRDIGRQRVLVDIADSVVRIGNVVLHENPVTLAAKNLNPTVGTDAGASLCTADAPAVGRGIDGIGLVRSKGNKGSTERSRRNRRHIGSVDHRRGRLISQSNRVKHNQGENQSNQSLHNCMGSFLVSRRWGGGWACRQHCSQDAAWHRISYGSWRSAGRSF